MKLSKRGEYALRALIDLGIVRARVADAADKRAGVKRETTDQIPRAPHER